VEPNEPETSRRARAIAASKDRAERLQRRAALERTRHRSVDVVFEAADRDGEIGGGLIAGALAYRFFIWLLPFALVVVAGLGLAADAADETPGETANDVGLGGIVTSSIANASKSSSRWYALLIGIPILLWTTRSFLRGLITAHRLVWQEGRGTAPKPTVAATFRLLLLLVACFAVPTLVRALRDHTDLGAIVATLLDWTIFAGLWLLIANEMPHRHTPWRALLPGALLFGIGVQILGAVITYFIAPWAADKQGTYGALGLAAALLLALFFITRLMVATAVLNATLWERRTRST
jgi:membrane protein